MKKRPKAKKPCKPLVIRDDKGSILIDGRVLDYLDKWFAQGGRVEHNGKILP